MTLRDRVKARAQSVLGDGKRIEGQEAEEKTLESPEVTGSKASDMKQTAEVSDDGHEQEENPMPKDGRISVQDGKVTVIPPEAGGRWPVIKPGSNVIVKVNGEVIKEKHTLADGEQVEILSADEQPTYEVRVNVSSTKMQAMASIQRHAGKRFKIRDIPEGPFAYIAADLEEIITPSDPTVEDVIAQLAEAKVVFGIDREAIEELIASAGGRPMIVAQGQPPQEPVDGSLQYLFTDLAEKDVDPDASRVDLYDRHTIPWVQPGDVLATRKEPQPGEPGTNVLGGTVRSRNYRNPVLSVGEGAELVDDGRRAVATREGRPILDGKTIKVVPTFLVPQNADASTGHIRFSGDVVVNGDVLDSIEVLSGGLVEISGLVSHAKVMGQKGAIVRKSVIGGRIQAGGVSAECKRILSVVDVLTLRLNELLKALQQLQRDPRMQQLKLADGQIIHQLLESRFNEIPKHVIELEDHAARSVEIFQFFPELIPTLRSRLIGLGPTGTSRWELQSLVHSLENFALHLEAMQAVDADIEVRSLQNATIEASGKVMVNGTGCYYSTIIAGKGVKAPRGLLRGGKVVVNEGNVEFKELGGPGGVATEVVIVNGGVIVAQTVHPNVSISIRGETRVFRDPQRRLRAYINEEGELVV